MKILLLKGRSQYNALRIFLDDAKEAFEGLGHEVVLLDLTDPEVMGQFAELLSALGPFDFAFSYIVCGEWRSPTGQNIGELIGGPHIIQHVDHPLTHNERVIKTAQNSVILTIDQSHADVLKSVFGDKHFAHVGFNPHAAIGEPVPLPDSAEAYAASRPPRFLFAGSYIIARKRKPYGRTTGATLAGEDESNFVKIHNQDFIAGKKRLYMTATPRVFGDAIKSKANEASAELCSMDDESLYGRTLFARGFGWAVENSLLTDYKVLVLAVDEQMVSGGVQNRLADGTSELKLDDATKIIGCYKALTKHGLKDELLNDFQPMKRALAFCKDIATSKLIQHEFASVIHEYLASDEGKQAEGDLKPLECELVVDHFSGTPMPIARNKCLSRARSSRSHDTRRAEH